jgi:hypothetical protein
MGIQNNTILRRKERKEGDSWSEEGIVKNMSRETIFPKGEEYVKLSSFEEN